MARVRIAQVPPLFEHVPPDRYGGTERVVSYLTEELVRAGHQVTLFAPGGSVTRARLVTVCPRPLRADPRCHDPVVPHLLMLERLAKQQDEFDLVHAHLGYLAYPFARRLGIPMLTTLHGRLDLPDLVPVYEEFREQPVVSISDAQRAPLPHANWVGTVYHGLPVGLFRFHPGPGRYLAFVGRASPEKRIDRAIEIARRADMPIRIAAKVDPADREYFAREVKPLLGGPGVEWLDEVDDDAKDALLGGASALVFPIDWPEPFGLAIIEALACGTPVVAFRRGSIPEIIEPGMTGFVVESVDEAVEAVQAAAHLDRRACRTSFERRFSVARMARDYLAIYARLLGGESRPARSAMLDG